MQCFVRRTSFLFSYFKNAFTRLCHSYRFVSLLSLFILLDMMVLLSVSDPVDWGSQLRCPVHRFLGLKCPGCGSMRALHHLMHGEMGLAIGKNFLAILMLPVLLISFVFGVIRERELRPNIRFFAWSSRLFVFILLIFTVARNFTDVF